MSCIKLLPLCSVPKVADREGRTGQFAYINAVGLGIRFASGQQFSAPGSVATQDTSRTYTGTVKPDTFDKGFPTYAVAECPL